MRAIYILLAFIAAVQAAEEVSLFDLVPVVAQVKSGFQLILGDKNGAEKTQENFLNKGMITSQARSGYFLVTGDPDKALDIQAEFASNIGKAVESVPVVGHIKGIAHFAAGEVDKGWSALKHATSGTGALVGGAFAGPLGAIAGHATTDLVISAIDTIVSGGGDKLHGLLDYALNIGNRSTGDHFDVLLGLGLDAAAGKLAKPKKISVVIPESGPVRAQNLGRENPLADVIFSRAANDATISRNYGFPDHPLDVAEVNKNGLSGPADAAAAKKTLLDDDDNNAAGSNDKWFDDIKYAAGTNSKGFTTVNQGMSSTNVVVDTLKPKYNKMYSVLPYKPSRARTGALPPIEEESRVNFAPGV